MSGIVECMAYLQGPMLSALLLQAQVKSGKAKSEKLDAKRKAAKAEHKEVGKNFYKQMTQESDYQGADYEVFDNWLNKTNAEA